MNYYIHGDAANAKQIKAAVMANKTRQVVTDGDIQILKRRLNYVQIKRN